MKVLILAGGFGTRMSEETHWVPKPMVLIQGKPMLWHIMNIYSAQGFNDFVIAGGYKVQMIQSWVQQFELPWKVTVVDTGESTQTAGRILKCLDLLGDEQFLMTYGDGLSNVSLSSLLDFHAHYRKTITVTAVRPPARFGVLEIENGVVTRFGEKNQADAGWINGGFFVVEPRIRDYLWSETQVLESDVLTPMAERSQLAAYMHYGFWAPMDTLREKNQIEEWAKMPIPPWSATVV